MALNQFFITFACLKNNLRTKNSASLSALGSVKRSLNFLPRYDSKIVNFSTSSPVVGNISDQSSVSKYNETLNIFYHRVSKRDTRGLSWDTLILTITATLDVTSPVFGN